MRSLVVALLLAVALPAVARPRTDAPKVGDVAPPFNLTLVDGTKVSSDELRGQVIVLNFWATWCAPCREELPLLDAYYAINQPHGLRVFAITSQDSVPLGRLKKLFASMKMPSVRKIEGRYPVLEGMPTNYIIDRSGHIRHAKAGAFTLNSLNDLLVPMLNEPVPPAPAAAP
ncbi:MAG: thiol:disulfide interchange protein [Alphaproteobacteria bacterium]|nr:MAG: thiol:disulfide interchange protein [Alphaproteobacteria bacterium]